MKLTDAVFGFALAVGALSLTATNPKTEQDVVGGLLLFSLSFVILVVIWWGTSDLIAKLDQGRSVTVFFNVLLLFFVAIEPYLLNLSVNPGLFPFSSTLYAFDMCLLMAISGALGHILVHENKSLTWQQLKFYSINRYSQFLFAGLFLFSIVPLLLGWTLAGTSVGYLIWFATLAVAIVISARNKSKLG